MMILEVLIFIMVSVLDGLKTVWGIKVWRGQDIKFQNIWRESQTYILILGWIVVYFTIWIAGGRTVENIRIVELLSTYIILTVIDAKHRIVPGTIVLCFLSSQLLMGALYQVPMELIKMLVGGLVFSIVIYAVTWFSKGNVGMGDAALLGATAIAAGWLFTLQILIMAMVLSMIYSIWLIVFRKKWRDTEFPFVPFLAMALMIYMIIL